MMHSQYTIRPARRDDQTAVLDLIERTGFFRPVEVEIAREVFNDAADMKPGCTYQSYVADADGKAVGWICFGATPCTLGTYDIYWVAVSPGRRKMGIGGNLIKSAEELIAGAAGRMVIVETSSTPAYQNTVRFYHNRQYDTVGIIPDFYRPGDDKLILRKILG